MGNTKSDLHLQLKQTIKEIIGEYQFWTNESICEKLEVVYLDKLIKYDKGNLTHLSLAIGISPPKHYDKNDICDNIINHYKKRIQVLESISKVIDKTQQQLLNSKKGPVCRGIDKYTTSMDTCVEKDGMWIGEKEYMEYLKIINNKDKRKMWIDRVNAYYSKYYYYFNELSKIIDFIKKDLTAPISNKMANEKFEIHKLKTLELIKSIQDVCDKIYFTTVNVPNTI